MKKFLIIFFLFVLAIFSSFSLDIIYGGKLNAEELAVLRKEYPFIENVSDDLYDGPSKDLGFRRYILAPDTYALSEVLEEPCKVTEIEGNYVQYVNYYHYVKIRIIKDTEGLFENNQVLNVYYMTFDQIHAPKAGDKVIIPLTVDEYEEGGIITVLEGVYYYVSSDGYAICSFKEKYDTGFNEGYRAEYLIDKRLKKTEKEWELYFEVKNAMYNSSGGRKGFIDYEEFKVRIQRELIAKNEEVINEIKSRDVG